MDDAELRALLALQSRLIAELSERIAPVRASLTVAQLYARYEAARSGSKSWRTCEVRLRAFAKEFGAREIASLRVHDWTEYRTGRASHYKASTLNLDLGWIKALLNWGVTQGLIDGNPLRGARRVKARSHRETAPTELEIGALLEESTTVERAIVLCAADAGMRCSETRSLSWAWLDRPEGLIRLPGWACKGGRGGAVPLTRRLLAALDAIPRDIRFPWIFVSPRGKDDGRYNRRTFSRWFAELRARAGLAISPEDGAVRYHDLRHGFGTNAARRGIGVKAISKMLRHSSLQHTDKYIQASDVDVRAAREAFERGIERDRRR